MSKLLIDTSSMREAGYEQQTIDQAMKHNQMIEKFLESRIGPHLRQFEDSDSEDASEGTLLSSEDIKQEIEQRTPGVILFPFGYLPIWSSVGGNVVLYRLEDQTFYWADHESFVDTHSITVPIEYKEISFSEENIPKALIEISKDSPEKFLSDLKAGAYTERLDELD